jgi:hypothetical protein
MLVGMNTRFGPSLLDTELALITWLARRAPRQQPARKVAKQGARRELTVLPEDAVWPKLSDYPYGNGC